MRKLLLFIVILIVLIAGTGFALQSGLADPLVKSQVESALLKSDMSEKQADCMSGRMVDRLSVWQLWKLRSGMAAREGESEQPDGFGDTIKRLRRVDDTEAVAVVTTSAGLCALGIG